MSGALSKVALILLAVLSAGGTATAGAAPAAPRCFGAAARDLGRPCENPRLRRAVVPTPREAQTLPNAPCTPLFPIEDKSVCAFGVAPEQATRTVALIGDSHAGHWRGALEVVAQARTWLGLSIGHSSCPLSNAVRDLPEPKRSHCARWKSAVFAWLEQHPEVHTVFVSQLSGGSGIVPSGGRGEFATAVAGYLSAWRALPPSVRRIVVIRDSPKTRGDLGSCVERAIARRRPAGIECAMPRRRVLDRDPAMAAAARMRPSRVRTVDLTRFFCDARRCFPVVGGALTHKDSTHLTAVFASTLGPFLLREVDRVLPSHASE